MNSMKIKKKTVICSLVIIGVIIIPLLYSVFYLGAFWDPYAKLQDLPVAVVNLDSGAEINDTDRNIGDEMCTSLKKDGTLDYTFTSKKKAIEGTKGNQYYAIIIIPENFSSSIASTGTSNKKIAEIKFIPNEKKNYLASQILKNAVDQIEMSLRGKVNSEIVGELCNQLESTPVQLGSLADGLNLLANGSNTLENGTQSLSKGTGKLKSGFEIYNSEFEKYEKGVAAGQSGANELLSGVKSLDVGIDKLTGGAGELKDATANLDELKVKTELLAEKTDEFNQGLQTYVNGVDTLITSAEQTSTFLQGYVSAHPELMTDPAFSQFISNLNTSDNVKNIQTLKQYSTVLKNASTQISRGTALLASNTSQLPALKEGISKLYTGLVSAQNGWEQLEKGSSSLAKGLSSIGTATSQLGTAGKQLANGVSTINQGASTLNQGATSLQNGIATASSSVDSAISNANSKLRLLDGLNQYAEAPVTTKKEAVDPVPNYGTAFAPYFLSLSLWVGALIIFFGIYLDADGKFKLLSRSSDRKLLRSFAYLLIGFVQAIFLGILLKVCLGLTVEHLVLYYSACCLVSLVFISIVQFLMVFLKDIGKFLSIALLILQLTSCGGTFPMETVPKFFNLMYPFMPMTYSVGLLKESISGSSGTNVGFNLAVLGGILVVFMTLTVLFSVARKTKAAGVEAKSNGNSIA